MCLCVSNDDFSVCFSREGLPMCLCISNEDFSVCFSREGLPMFLCFSNEDFSVCFSREGLPMFLCFSDEDFSVCFSREGLPMFLCFSNDDFSVYFNRKAFPYFCVSVMKTSMSLCFSNEDFPMFVSMLDHKDLIFQDSTVRLVRVPPSKQDYKSYLGLDFVRAMERMENIDCITTGGACVNVCSHFSLVFVSIILALNHWLSL